MKYKCFLLFGSPGSGKGTQGRILGNIPGFCHVACGDVFRALDTRSELGQLFLQYSSEGNLVPDDITVRLWEQHIENMVILGRFKPEIDHLVLDGIPRNLEQAKLLKTKILVRHVYHLSCPDRSKLVERLKKRALKDNRLDDANEKVIADRLITYEKETKPVLEYYGLDFVSSIDATQHPYQVLRDILKDMKTD